MRAGVVVALFLASTPMALGCIHHETASGLHAPNEISSSESMSSSSSSSESVRCRCDASGNLHVHAPQSSVVTRGSGEDAEAQIVLPEDKRPPARPLRTTQSLGFIGDAPLTPSRTHGGPWAAPDALLPKHAHGHASYGYSSYGYRSYGYRGYPAYPAYPYPPPYPPPPPHYR